VDGPGEGLGARKDDGIHRDGLARTALSNGMNEVVIRPRVMKSSF